MLPTFQPYCIGLGRVRANLQLLQGSPGVTRCKRFRNQRFVISLNPRQNLPQTVIYSSRQGNPAVATAGCSPVQFLQAVELAALTVAAAFQAVVLVNAAAKHVTYQQHNQHQTAAEAEAELTQAAPLHECQTLQQQQQAESESTTLQQAISTAVRPTTATGFGFQLQSMALLLALMCGVALRYLQRPRLLTGNPSADAAARLVAVEINSQQQAAQLTTMAQHLDKLQARVRLATSDLKVPLRQAQGSASQAAAALTKLSEQQQQLQRQLDGSQELIAALQGVAAKQFKVSAEAMQQLRSSQSHLSSSTATALADVRQQQQVLQQLLEQQQRQLKALQQQGGWQQQQQQHEGQSASSSVLLGEGFSSSSSNSDNSSSCNGQMPDPWSKSEAAVQRNGSVSANSVVSS